MREGWSYKKLGEVCAPKKDIQRANKCFSKDDEIQYIDISSLDNSIQKITGTSLYIFEDAPSRAQQCVKKGDILVSLVRPNLKNIAIVDSCSNNLVASSGFCVLRESVMIDKSYLFYFINSDKTTNYLCSLAAGANYPAIREEDIRGCIIGVPPLATQQQIVSELDLLSHILDQKRQQLKEYDALAESIFYDMFGDPVENPKGWEKKKLGDVVKVISGFAFPSSKFRDNNPLKAIKITNVGVGEFIEDKSSLPDEYLAMSDYRITKGSIVIALTRTVISSGFKRAYVSTAYDGALLNQRVAALSEICIEKEFLYTYLGTFFVKEYVLEKSKALMQPNLSVADLKKLPVYYPPLTLQRSFAAKIESIEHQKQLLRASIKETEMLFQSRMDYWFNG